MSNPYLPPRSAETDAQIRDGRKRLLARWRTRPFNVDQPHGYRIDFNSEVLDGNAVLDQFYAVPATKTAPWLGEAAKYVSFESHPRGFIVNVDHRLYSPPVVTIGWLLRLTVYAGAAVLALLIAARLTDT